MSNTCDMIGKIVSPPKYTFTNAQKNYLVVNEQEKKYSYVGL